MSSKKIFNLSDKLLPLVPSEYPEVVIFQGWDAFPSHLLAAGWEMYYRPASRHSTKSKSYLYFLHAEKALVGRGQWGLGDKICVLDWLKSRKLYKQETTTFLDHFKEGIKESDIPYLLSEILRVQNTRPRKPKLKSDVISINESTVEELKCLIK